LIISRPVFRSSFVRATSQSWVNQTIRNLQRLYRTVIDVFQVCLRFPVYRSVLKTKRLKGDWVVGKLDQISNFFISVKITGKMGEVSQSVFTPIIRAQEACFRLPTRRCVSKPHRFRCDGGRKSKPNFALMTPCKNRGGAGEMSESFFSWQTLNPRHPTHPAGLSGRESGWQRSAGVKHETSRLSSGGLITRLYIRIFFGQKTDWLNRVRCCCNPTIECLFSRGKHLRPVGVISDYSFTRIDCLTVIQSFASVHYYWPTVFFLCANNNTSAKCTTRRGGIAAPIIHTRPTKGSATYSASIAICKMC